MGVFVLARAHRIERLTDGLGVFVINAQIFEG